MGRPPTSMTCDVRRMVCGCINPNSHAPFFVSRLSPRKGRGPKMGVPPGFRTGDLPHHNALFTHGTPLGCHCPAAISFPYETRFYDVIGLSAFLHFPLLDFVGLWTVMVNEVCIEVTGCRGGCVGVGLLLCGWVGEWVLDKWHSLYG